MKYLLSQEEMDEFNSDNNIANIAALELRLKELEDGIIKFVSKSKISSHVEPQDFGKLSVNFYISSSNIPESIANYMRMWNNG